MLLDQIKAQMFKAMKAGNTVEKEILEKSSYISIEQALNELPQFMAGGALNGASAVTGLTAAGDVMGGAGTGNMFDTARPVDNARAGQYTPGAATVNLRGLGPNRNIVLIDGRRGGPTNASGAIDLNTVPQITAADLRESLKHGAVTLVDVRNPNEWTESHIDGARHIPLGYLADRVEEIPKTKPIVVQCLSGGRSSIAASILQARGVEKVINLSGGISDWIKSGYPTVSS
jgi:rhodanese-related sulfurtransferase